MFFQKTESLRYHLSAAIPAVYLLPVVELMLGFVFRITFFANWE
jgi:hypothetical protein